MIGDSMGLGKSAQALAIAYEQLDKGEKVCIVCPSYLKANWCNEVYKFSKNPTLHVQVLEKGNCFRDIDPDADVYIISYTLLKHANSIFMNSNYIIADEAHYLKNRDAQRTKLFSKYIYMHSPEYCVMLTGTPVRNHVADFYAPLSILSKGTANGVNINSLYKDYFHFCETFCYKQKKKIGNRYFYNYFGLRNIEELRIILKDKYLRRRSEDVLDLPPIIEKEIFITYLHKTKDIREAWLRYQDDQMMTEPLMRAKRELAIHKTEYTIRYAQGLLDEGYSPLVIYSDHPDAVREIYNGLTGNGVFVVGDTPMKERADYVNKFQRGGLDFIVASLRSFSEGINLTRAKNMVFNDLSWVQAINEQAVKRIHRIGQESRTIIHYLLGARIDSIIARSVKAKRDIVTQLEAVDGN
jgi:SNF2 family DNA or RNA helicase